MLTPVTVVQTPNQQQNGEFLLPFGFAPGRLAKLSANPRNYS